jgi:hypothetical protein
VKFNRFVLTDGAHMQYVEIDPRSGDVSWDAYFDYLATVQNEFPGDLYAYAANRSHYSPDGRNTLHAAWLIGVQLGYRAQDVVLAFLSSWHDRKHVLTYTGVESYSLNVEVTYKAGDRDVLAHEFRLDDGLVTHEIAFRTGKILRITARDVIPATEVLS